MYPYPIIEEMVPGTTAVVKDVSKEMAEKAAREAAEKAAREAAQQAAREAVEQAAKEAAEQAAKEATQQLARGAVQQGAKEAVKETTQGIVRESVEGIVRESAQGVARETVKETTQGIIRESAQGVARETVQETTEGVAKETVQKGAIEVAQQGAKETSKDVAEKAAKMTSTEFLKKYGKAMIYGTVTIAAAVIAGVAADKASKLNNTTYTITSIKPDSVDKSKTIITYTPNDAFSTHDAVSIIGSNSIPSIDGEGYAIERVAGGIIKIGKSITQPGTKGTLLCITTFGNVVSDSIKDIGGTILTPTAEIGGNILSDLIPKQLKDGFSQFWWVSLIVILMFMFLSMSIILR